ncbi:MAG: hypothetical protein H6668_18485 [Ardenticatenaceae bacterium]|nr:hypothetical protein [Ardenticatenaceae bacterium]
MTNSNPQTFKVPARRSNSQPWGNSVMHLDEGDEIKIVATGKVRHTEGGSQIGPTGTSFPGKLGNLAPHINAVALIAKVGDLEPFLVGDGTTYTVPQSGDLYFSVNSYTWSFEDNEGEFDVTVAKSISICFVNSTSKNLYLYNRDSERQPLFNYTDGILILPGGEHTQNTYPNTKWTLSISQNPWDADDEFSELAMPPYTATAEAEQRVEASWAP